MKDTICTISGVIGGFIAALFGGWDSALVKLLIFMDVYFATDLSQQQWENPSTVKREN